MASPDQRPDHPFYVWNPNTGVITGVFYCPNVARAKLRELTPRGSAAAAEPLEVVQLPPELLRQLVVKKKNTSVTQPVDSTGISRDEETL